MVRTEGGQGHTWGSERGMWTDGSGHSQLGEVWSNGGRHDGGKRAESVTHRWQRSPLMPLVVQKHLPLLGLHMAAWPLHLQAEREKNIKQTGDSLPPQTPPFWSGAGQSGWRRQGGTHAGSCRRWWGRHRSRRCSCRSGVRLSGPHTVHTRSGSHTGCGRYTGTLTHKDTY